MAPARWPRTRHGDGKNLDGPAWRSGPSWADDAPHAAGPYGRPAAPRNGATTGWIPSRAPLARQPAAGAAGGPPPDRRSSFIAMFDEFQEFLDSGRDMAAFFERSRSYGMGLTVATHNPNHVRLRSILDSVLINTRTHVVFGGVATRCATSPTRWRRR